MAVQSPDEFFDLWNPVVEMIAEGQLSLQKLIAELATETRRGFDQAAGQFCETDAPIDKLALQTAKLAHEGAERS